MINKYPYTDFNEYNMDWIIKTVKDLSVQWAETHQEWQDVQTEWTNYKNYIDNYFAQLDLSQEVSDKIDQMAADGYFSDLFVTLFTTDVQTQAAATTSAWITDNLLQETGYVIDSSLTVANAAADAAATGERLSLIETDELVTTSIIEITAGDVVQDEYVAGSDGLTSSSIWYDHTDYIDISDAKLGSMLAVKGTFNGWAGIAFYNKEKKYISGIYGNNAVSEGYTVGTAYRAILIPENAYYCSYSILKADYSDPSELNIRITKSNDFVAYNTIVLSADNMEFGNISNAGDIIPTSLSRCVSPLMELKAGDKITNASVNMSVFEYDKTDLSLLASTAGSWVHTYTIVNDCYARILFNTSDFASAASAPWRNHCTHHALAH